MKALVALLLASQFALPTATAAPVATAGTDPAPVAVTADAAESTDTTNTADATDAVDAPVAVAPANVTTNNTINGHPQYQSRQAIGKFLGCRDNPRYPWCWR